MTIVSHHLLTGRGSSVVEGMECGHRAQGGYYLPLLEAEDLEWKVEDMFGLCGSPRRQAGVRLTSRTPDVHRRSDG
ncbi:unnamed protein product [Nezara viridula]|uniref:Uncharacterized protein n=1 Tax=Nezara viridula TaxID=85310 RepID=A0A9P0EBZ9_NEZVI|nr:unnamed protein product [Nezara viridula]